MSAFALAFITDPASTNGTLIYGFAFVMLLTALETVADTM